MFLAITGCFSLSAAFVLVVLDLLRYKTTAGQVIGWRRSDAEQRPAYAPRVRYHTETGATREFQACCYLKDRPGQIGRHIPVRYHPTIPWLHGVDRWTHRWLPPIFFGLVGTAFIAFGLLQ